MIDMVREFLSTYHHPTKDDLEEFCSVMEIDSDRFIAVLRRVLMRKARVYQPQAFRLEKAKRAPIGAISKDGERRKIGEGNWVPVKSTKDIPKKITDKVPSVPPSWTNVQYFDDPDSKLLVKGEDAKGRIQYVYNPDHVTAASKEKFARINALNERFDAIASEN